MSGNKPAVLIVDDEPSSIDVLCQILTSVCEIYIAKTGADAIHLCDSNSFDMILMDVELPDMSGVEICRQLKANDRAASVPVIFISGHSDLIFEVQAFKAGAVDYLVKPVSPVRVLLRMNVHLDSKLPLPANS